MGGGRRSPGSHPASPTQRRAQRARRSRTSPSELALHGRLRGHGLLRGLLRRPQGLPGLALGRGIRRAVAEVGVGLDFSVLLLGFAARVGVGRGDSARHHAEDALPVAAVEAVRRQAARVLDRRPRDAQVRQLALVLERLPGRQASGRPRLPHVVVHLLTLVRAELDRDELPTRAEGAGQAVAPGLLPLEDPGLAVPGVPDLLELRDRPSEVAHAEDAQQQTVGHADDVLGH
mmetsp:Transcript_7263/g.15407  ORF Transcript_7263/g.15407 Transcript_7263/m.15407 type:complete len:232 (+) Transcript_7263:79-774(+)